MVEIKKQWITIPVSSAMVEQWDGERFPRKGHAVTHPITPVQRIKYNAFVERWNGMTVLRDALYEEGERERWARGDSGYEWEPAELRPLEPRVEWIHDETEEEWRERLRANKAHHDATGEWLDEPQQPLMERMFDSAYTRMLDAMSERENMETDHA